MKSTLFRIKRRLRWECHKWYDYIYKNIVFTPKILNDVDMVHYILFHNASMARFGDGELLAIEGKDLNFQPANSELSQKLKMVLSMKEDKLMVCLPDTFEHLERYNQVEKNFWKSHFYFHRRNWYKFIKKNQIYGSTFISRFYSMEFNQKLAKTRVANLKRLWDCRDIVFVEGKDSKMGVCNDLFDNANSIQRIICPSKNAYSRYNEILDAARAVSKDKLFILALGPTATVLAADLCLSGYQALDLGHMDIEYEWYLMGATKKVGVRGKFTNEAVLTGNAKKEVEGNIDLQKYDNEIICTIL